MHLISFNSTFAGWQEKAREALGEEWVPESIEWQESGEAQPRLNIFEESQPGESGSNVRVPRTFLRSASLAALHADAGKWPLLYRILWRLTHGEARILERPTDPDTIALTHYEKEVSKDAYRMLAFLRFREVRVEDGSWFVAWYEPEHNVVALNADFFVDRFSRMRWSILTPARCMHWDGEKIAFTEGVEKTKAPQGDAVEPLWIGYYSNIFNPARLKVRAMQAQLLKRNWKNLPEASVIEPLIRRAPARGEAMLAASEFKRARESDFGIAPVPMRADWTTLAGAAAACRACPLWKNTTSTVFGEGPVHSRVVFVGEQPGDQEDRVGRPFVGPAGRLFNRALIAAGIDRSGVYVTNAVKHFKFEPRGKRRIHKTASPREIAACRPWLMAELDLIKPTLVVALGGTAARALFQSPIRITEERGRIHELPTGKTLITIHPSALLRLPEGADFESEFGRFVADLKKIHAALV